MREGKRGEMNRRCPYRPRLPFSLREVRRGGLYTRIQGSRDQYLRVRPVKGKEGERRAKTMKRAVFERHKNVVNRILVRDSERVDDEGEESVATVDGKGLR